MTHVEGDDDMAYDKGTGQGIHPGRVVWERDPRAVNWDGSGRWWRHDHFDEPAIAAMLDDGLRTLTGEADAAASWDALFRWSNARHGTDGGYVRGQRIAVKANLNGTSEYGDDPDATDQSYVNAVLLRALLLSLVRDAGADPSDLSVYDTARLFPRHLTGPCGTGVLAGVRFVGLREARADTRMPLRWSRRLGGHKSYLPTVVTEATYLVNLATLKGHCWGITLCGKNHFGSFVNRDRRYPPMGADLHLWVTGAEEGSYSPITDLMANAQLGGKTVLYLQDCLLTAQTEGSAVTREANLWESPPFDGSYPASLLVSQDPVAIDCVGADILAREPAITRRNRAVAEARHRNYLVEAALADHAPSGTRYRDGAGHDAPSLGTLEPELVRRFH